MKYEEYIKKLDSLNEEFEEGLLQELQEKPPTNLHGEIMKSVYREKRRINFFNYRIYAPAVAAALIFAVILNRPEILERINLAKNPKITQEKTLATTGTNDPKKHQKVGINTADPNVDNERNINEIQNSDNAAGDTSAVDSQTSDDNSSNEKLAAATGSNNTAQERAADTKSTTKNGTKDTNTSASNGATDSEIYDSEEMKFNLSNLWGMVPYEEPKINYEIVLANNKSAVLNFITENYEEKLNTPYTYKLSLEQFENLDKLLGKYNIRKKAINESLPEAERIVKIYFVNYHIGINTSAPDVINFIEDQSKCIKLDDSTYKISSEYLDGLNKALSSAGIKKEIVSDVEDKFVIFKTTIINYSLSINESQTSVINFLKNTEKCRPAGDNIYKMNTEVFNAFKEILSSLNIQLSLLNETSNQDVLINITTN